MKNLISMFLMVLILASCGKEDPVVEVQQELTSIDEFMNEEAAEILRHNLLHEYGGVFSMHKKFHEKIRVEGVECNANVSFTMMDSDQGKFTLSTELDMATQCKATGSISDYRIYDANHQLGQQITSSDLFDLEMRIQDSQILFGNVDDGIYSYGHAVLREVLITKGMAAEIEPRGNLSIVFNTCTYDEEKVELTEISKASFRLVIKTDEPGGLIFESKTFEGTIEMVEGVWTAIFEDGSAYVL